MQIPYSFCGDCPVYFFLVHCVQSKICIQAQILIFYYVEGLGICVYNWGICHLERYKGTGDEHLIYPSSEDFNKCPKDCYDNCFF